MQGHLDSTVSAGEGLPSPCYKEKEVTDVTSPTPQEAPAMTTLPTILRDLGITARTIEGGYVRADECEIFAVTGESVTSYKIKIQEGQGKGGQPRISCTLSCIRRVGEVEGVATEVDEEDSPGEAWRGRCLDGTTSARGDVMTWNSEDDGEARTRALREAAAAILRDLEKPRPTPPPPETWGDLDYRVQKQAYARFIAATSVEHQELETKKKANQEELERALTLAKEIYEATIQLIYERKLKADKAAMAEFSAKTSPKEAARIRYIKEASCQ